jgi:hypothetical protein
VSTFARKFRILDDKIDRTDELRQSSENVRSPLLAYANKRIPLSADDNPQASDLGVLQQQKAELDALIAVAKTLAPAVVAAARRCTSAELFVMQFVFASPTQDLSTEVVNETNSRRSLSFGLARSIFDRMQSQRPGTSSFRQPKTMTEYCD